MIKRIEDIHFAGKVLVIRGRRFYCRGGFGCKPGSAGKVFGTWCETGIEDAMHRNDILFDGSPSLSDDQTPPAEKEATTK